jgi:sugar phosphate permease
VFAAAWSTTSLDWLLRGGFWAFSKPASFLVSVFLASDRRCADGAGCNFYLSCWYKRSEFGVRSAIFFSAAAIAGSFGGLLAWSISQMDGVGGKPGWAWIFILEGLATILIGIASTWMVHDFPDEANFLSAEDRVRVYHRLKVDQQASAEREAFKWTYVTASLKDWKTYTSCLIFMGQGGGLYAFSLFLPSSMLPRPMAARY